jgi:hypothetical protein
MSVSGRYELELTCDGTVDDVRPGLPCNRRQTFSAPIRAQAKADARSEGWLLAKKSNRAYCSEHHPERHR